MANYKNLAVNDINSYIWDQIKENNLLSSNDYYVESFMDNVIPIVPSQQIPEFNNLLPGKPYLVYDYETKPTMENWWVTEEILYITVISTDYDQINQIMNMISDTFRRYDDSASDINSFLNNATDFKFHYLYLDGVSSPEPFKREGAYLVGQVTICYSYSRDLDSNGRFK